MMETEKPKRKHDEKSKNDAYQHIRNSIWVYLIIMVMVVLVVIVILALSGPKIGNIFSNIVDGLPGS